MDEVTLGERNHISALLEASRKELLDLGLRNPLLNYRPYKARGIEVVDELPAEVFRSHLINREGGNRAGFKPVRDGAFTPFSESTTCSKCRYS